MEPCLYYTKLIRFFDVHNNLLLLIKATRFGTAFVSSHLEVAQGAEARWDFFHPIVVQVDLSDVRDVGKASVFDKLDMVKTQS